jgi:hypothetical protein
MSARIESKRMTNHNTPQLSGMDSANHCAAFTGLSALSTTTIYTRHNTNCLRELGQAVKTLCASTQGLVPMATYIITINKLNGRERIFPSWWLQVLVSKTLF